MVVKCMRGSCEGVSMAMLPAPLRLAALPLGLVLVLSGPLFAQQSSPSPQNSQPLPAQPSGDQFTFRENVNRVVVDVVVTDANGKAVHGLTKQDFSIYEDGVPQNTLSFDAYNLDSNPSYFAKVPPMPANTFVNIATAPERGPLYVLLLDLVNTTQGDQPTARQQLLKFISGKPEGTRFAAIVLSDGMYLVQGFTADRSQLYAAFDPSHPRAHVPRIFLFARNYGRGDPAMMVNVFKQIAFYLDGLPGRKNIIWFSGQFPLDLFPHSADRPNLRAEAIEALDALTRSESAIYPVDVTGVDPDAPRLTGAVPGAGPASGSSSASAGSGPGMGSSGGSAYASASNSAGSSPWDSDTVQDAIAKMTGGRAFYSRNDLKDMLEEATEAGADYYTLTYSPSNLNFDGRLRNIRIQLAPAEKNYHLEYRHGYLATAPQSPIMPVSKKSRKQEDTANLRPIGDSLSAYMQFGAPIARQVYFRAHVHALSRPQLASPAQMANLVDQPTYFRVRQRKHPNKPLTPIRLQTYLVEYQIIAKIPNLEVAAGVYDEDARLLNGDVEEATSANPSAPDPKADFTYFRVQQKIDVPVNATALRLGVRDRSTDRMGTMEIPLPLAPEP